MSKKKVVCLGGQGIGPEVVDAACYVLEEANFNVDIIKPIHGEAALEQCNSVFPEKTRMLCDEADAILFGAVKAAGAPILAYLRWVYDNYINVRPVKYYPGARSPLKDPTGIDFVLIRENSEGLYPDREGDLSLLAKNLPGLKDGRVGKAIGDYGEGKFAIRVISVRGARRIASYACDYTLQRKKKNFPGKLTCVTKSNILRETCGLFRNAVEEECKKYLEVTYEHYYIDDMARRLIRYPREMDVIVTSNLFGDILSDEAAELVGGLGLCASACIGGKVAYFEPCHGAAPKYAGKNAANPTAAILAAKLMLDYLRMPSEAQALEKAVAAVYAEGKSLTYDQGGNATTTECAEAILRKIK
jgi:isocitrate/isopropylmalate dehydrogenase